MLEPVGVARAASLLAGDLSLVNPGRGWPHADTMSALSMAAEAGSDADTGWLIELDGTVIGDIGTYGGITALADPPAREVEIGYGLSPSFRGAGYATEAVRALTSWLLTQPGTAVVLARTDVGNDKSMAVLRRCGFDLDEAATPEGTLWRRHR